MVKDSKKYLRQIAPGKSKARKSSSRDIPEQSDDEEPTQRLSRPSGEAGSQNAPARRLPDIQHDLEPPPADAVLLDTRNWDAPVSETQPRPMKRLPAQYRPNIEYNQDPPPVRPVFSEAASNRDAPASERQLRPAKRVRVDQAQTPTVFARNQDDSPSTGTNLQPPSTSHPTRLSQPGASRKRKQVDLGENKLEERPARSTLRLVSGSQVQQPMHRLSDQPGPLHPQVHHYQIPPAGPSSNNTEYRRYVDYHDNTYRHPYNHFDAPQPHYQGPLAGPSNTSHPYYANYNMHHRNLPPRDNFDYLDDEDYTGLR